MLELKLSFLRSDAADIPYVVAANDARIPRLPSVLFCYLSCTEHLVYPCEDSSVPEESIPFGGSVPYLL